MKKIGLAFFIFFIFLFNVEAADKVDVILSDCIDGDTAKIILNGEKVTVRFLAIDTPETSHPTKGEEPYGKEAKEYTCKALKQANKIELEFDKGSDKTDKYGRYLAWIWADDSLLQDNLIQQGLAEVAYLYGDYKYTSILQEHQTLAKLKKVGKWSDYNPLDKNFYYLVGGITVIIILVFSGLLTKAKGKQYIKKILKKYGK